LRRYLAVLTIALLAGIQASAINAAQRNDSPTPDEPWECTQCRVCKDNAKKVCGDTKACTSNCTQLCVLCSQKSLTGNGAIGGSSTSQGRPQKLQTPP
jgi:hypothetical protein